VDTPALSTTPRFAARLWAARGRIALYIAVAVFLAAAYRFRILPKQADVLLDYFLYMSAATTFTPLPTPPVIIHAATQAPVFLVALVGALGTVVAYLIEYAVLGRVLGRVLALDRLRGVRENRAYLKLTALFDRMPFVSLAVAAFLPLPVDGVRLLAIARRYDRARYALAAFIGRLPRYAMIAGLGYGLRFVLPFSAAAEPPPPVPAAAEKAADPALAATLARLDRALAELEDAHGRFHQERWSPAFEEPDRASGELWFRRPGDLVLHYREPEPQEMVVDSAGVWIYLVKQKQAQRHPFATPSQRDAALAVLWQPSAVLARRYEITASATPPAGEKAGTWLRLVPRDKDLAEVVQVLYLRIGAKSGLSDCIIVEQRDGQRARLVMDAIEKNPGLPPERFRFRPPAGVDVIRF
jgi:outer membrane lipoprotein carrier protein